MTELEYIEIEGFKGLEHVEFEPTDVNLITGRNNTGKTSFLEAINMLFDPARISSFSGNFSSVVNINFDECNIRGTTSNETWEMIIEYPSEEDTEEYFIHSVINSISMAVGGSSGLLPYDKDTSPECIVEVERSINQAIRRVVKSSDDYSFRGICLVLVLNGGNYPYIDAGEILPEIYPKIHSELKQILESKFQNVGFGDHRGMTAIHLPSEEESAFFDFRGRIWEGSFLEDSPPRDPLKFITSQQPPTDVLNIEKDEDAIIVDDIGDYIKDTGIVDDVKTLTPNYVIFEREKGGKYRIPFDFMGDGFKSIVGLLWELMDNETENSIVLLEEPETHMHPGYIREVVYFLIQLAREEDVQLFITTHDSDFINDFFTENLTDEEESYLEDEFSLLRLEEDSAVVEDYETARENLKDLHLDLRGI